MIDYKGLEKILKSDGNICYLLVVTVSQVHVHMQLYITA